jgi:glutamyl-tRNA synthetase
MTMREMEELFSIEGLQPSPGVFDIAKLQWMNGHYLRQLSASELYDRVRSFHENSTDEEYRSSSSAASLGNAFASLDRHYVETALTLEQERVKLLSEFADACEFFFVEIPEMDGGAVDKWLKEPKSREVLGFLKAHLSGRHTITAEECDALVSEAAAACGLEKRAQAIHPTRVALSGRTFGPGLFELMSLLGPERMVARIEQALSRFSP